MRREGRYHRLDWVFLDSRLAPEYDGADAHGGEQHRHHDADRQLDLARLQTQRQPVTSGLLRAPHDLRERLLAVHRGRLALDIPPLVPAEPPHWWTGR